MSVAVAEVCQYQFSLFGGVPVLLIVTPVGRHWGEFDVGLEGIAGIAYTFPFRETLSILHISVALLMLVMYNRKVTDSILVKPTEGRATITFCKVLAVIPELISEE